MSDISNPNEGNEFSEGTTTQPDNELLEIAELSKKGYQFLKENRVAEAEKNFKKILENDPENNYEIGRASCRERV